MFIDLRFNNIDKKKLQKNNYRLAALFFVFLMTRLA